MGEMCCVLCFSAQGKELLLKEVF